MNEQELADVIEQELIKAADYLGLPHPFDIEFESDNGRIWITYRVNWYERELVSGCYYLHMTPLQIRALAIGDFVGGSNLHGNYTSPNPPEMTDLKFDTDLYPKGAKND